MLRKNRISVALFFIALVLGISATSSITSAESFDKPVRKTIVSLGWSPALMPNNRRRIQLTCFYYPTFIVKQLNDPGEKGPQWVTIANIPNGKVPPCRRAHDPAERFIDGKNWWYFLGAKGSLLFMEAADGSSGGMPFRILDSKTGKKVFEDSVWWEDHLKFVTKPDGKLTVRYLRLVEGNCSIPKDGISCWSKLKQQYRMAFDTVPECTGYRHEGEKEWVVGDAGEPPEPITTASAIAFPVELQFFPRPSIRVVPGQVKCSPVE
jgi:hypothetical protein